MISLNTNHGAIASLDVMRSIASNLGDAQDQISSGYRIGKASNNSSYWSISTTMRSDDKALSAVEDSMGLAAATIDVAYTGMTTSLDVVNEIKAKLVAAREPGVDKGKINKELTELKAEIYTIVESSSFAGENWLHRIDATDDGDKSMVGSFYRDGSDNVSVGTITYEMSNPWGTNHLIDENYHNGILTNVEFARDLGTATEWVLMSGKNHAIHQDMELTSTTTDQDVEEMISVVDAMIGAMIDAAASLGAISKRVSIQTEYTKDLRDSLQTGVGGLVDADMNEQSTRLKALQTRQQLATQSLSIANAGPDQLLQLFQN